MIYGGFMLFPFPLDGVCALRGVLIFYVETIVLLLYVSPAKHSLLYRATDGVSQVWMRDWSWVACANTHVRSRTHTLSPHLPERTGPCALGSVPTCPGDLQRHTLFTSSISPVRGDWRLDRWGAVCRPVLETQKCTAVFIVWLSGLVKRVMIRNDISSAHHTHHLFIRGRK